MLIAGPGYADTETTGVALKFANLNADWKFSDGTREARTNSLILSLEQSASTGLVVGGSFGYHDVRLDGHDGGDSISFDAQNLEIYLRQAFALSASITLQGLLSYAWYTGDESDDGDRADLDWSQVSVEIGANFRRGNWGITPFASYTNLDGDTSGVEDGGGFELDDAFDQGVRFDIFVDSASFISIELRTGGQTGGYLGFVHRY